MPQKYFAEFFAGIGLMRSGLEEAGWKIAVANDIDPLKQRLYRNHFTDSDNHFLLEDIHKLKPSDIPEISLATASFPCTDLSLAGRRAGLQGAQSSAFWGFVHLLSAMKSKKPPLILLENVPGFLTSNEGRDFYNALKALNDLGYSVDAFIIDASHFVPQSRVRLFIVGKHNEPSSKRQTYIQESGIRNKKLLAFIHKHPNINWSINDHLPELPRSDEKLKDIIESVPKDSKLWWNQKRVDYLLAQTFQRHLTPLLELKKDSEYNYVTAFRRVREGRSMAEIRFDGIAGCLRTPKGGSARQILLEAGKDEINVRLLTPRECARLMGADSFNITGTPNEALFGFGDAVCVPVVTWIAENYLNAEFEKLNEKVMSTNNWVGAYAAVA